MATAARAHAHSTPLALIELVRPRLWARNLLVVAVPIAAGTMLQHTVLVRTAQAFGVLCLAASAGYCLNDIIDAPADARHPIKCQRPVASGRVSAPLALVLSAALAILSVVLAWPGSLRWVVVGYLVLTIAYSTALKREPVLELALVAGGFLLRAIAGGAATGTPVSTWFLIVTGFGSLFMVTGKRLAEFVTSGPEQGTRSSLASYSENYLRLVLGISASVTIAAYCLWAFGIANEAIENTYAALSVVPFVLAMLRYSLDVDRGRGEEPERIVVRDRVLQGLAVLWAVAFWMAAMT